MDAKTKGKNAPAENRTRGSTMATLNFTTKPLALNCASPSSDHFVMRILYCRFGLLAFFHSQFFRTRSAFFIFLNRRIDHPPCRILSACQRLLRSICWFLPPPSVYSQAAGICRRRPAASSIGIHNHSKVQHVLLRLPIVLCSMLPPPKFLPLPTTVLPAGSASSSLRSPLSGRLSLRSHPSVSFGPIQPPMPPYRHHYPRAQWDVRSLDTTSWQGASIMDPMCSLPTRPKNWEIQRYFDILHSDFPLCRSAEKTTSRRR